MTMPRMRMLRGIYELSIMTYFMKYYNHSAMPPWPEHVPLLLWLKLYVPSAHLADAPAGTLPSFE